MVVVKVQMGISSIIYLVNEKLTLENISSCRKLPQYTWFERENEEYNSIKNNKDILIFPSMIDDISIADCFIKYVKDFPSFISEVDKDIGEAISIILNKEVLMGIYEKWIFKFMNPLVFLNEFDDMVLLNDFRILFSILEYGNIQIYYCW